MDELDFSGKPKRLAGAEAAARSAAQSTVPSPLYDPKLALEFFSSTGMVENKPAGKPIFTEKEKAGGLFSKGPRMYLLLDGDIGLMMSNRFLGSIKPGQVFGELAVVADLPRSATAVAKIDCSVISLDEKQFHSALQKKPEFALMLMSIMVQRLRESMAKLGAGTTTAGTPANRGGVLDPKAVDELAKELGAQTAGFEQGRVIMSAGAVGAFMYVVTQGRVAISVGASVVEHVGPGGIFGEMALVERSARAATVTAETDCLLLPISRADALKLVEVKPLFGASLLRSIAERMYQVAQQVARLPG